MSSAPAEAQTAPSQAPNVFETEDDFQAWLATQEDEAGVELQLDRTKPGSAVDSSAADYIKHNPDTWQPLDPWPRGNAIFRSRRYLCHCNGVSKLEPLAPPDASSQDAYLAAADRCEGRGR
jgi:hypothetical protein